MLRLQCGRRALGLGSTEDSKPYRILKRRSRSKLASNWGASKITSTSLFSDELKNSYCRLTFFSKFPLSDLISFSFAARDRVLIASSFFNAAL